MKKSTFSLVGNAVAAVFFCIGCGGDNNGVSGGGGGNYDPKAIAMIYVDNGTFMMGCTTEQGDECQPDENPEHSVTLREFYIGKNEVTQGLWKAVMEEENPSFFTGDNLPVENVSYSRVQSFIAALNAKTGKTYRLPTEAEWEYAARGGKKSTGYRFSGSNTIGNVAWYDQNSGGTGGKTHPVGTKTPNELGIYDMSGNVWEWVSDWYGEAYYSASPAANPQGPAPSVYRVIRGGGFDGEATVCRNSRRRNVSPAFSYQNLGFRLALSP